MNRKDHTLEHIDPTRQRVWDAVSHFPMRNLWDFRGVPRLLIVKRTFNAVLEDNLLSRAAELGYYFLFALFPTLVSASAILGLVARSAINIYLELLERLALVVPHDALGMVLSVFRQTTAQASSGKITFGIAAALWSASVGFSAIQDTLNTVYKVKETRPYWKARGSAILVTVLLSLVVTLMLASMFAATFFSIWIQRHILQPQLALVAESIVKTIAWAVAALLCILLFAVIYYFAPDVRNKRWRWLTPGAALGIGGWLLASLVLRVYLHYFDSYALTYGSLGAVIVLLTWFYLTGLMLLVGAEINSEIEAAATERALQQSTAVTSDKATPPQAA